MWWVPAQRIMVDFPACELDEDLRNPHHKISTCYEILYRAFDWGGVFGVTNGLNLQIYNLFCCVIWPCSLVSDTEGTTCTGVFISYVPCIMLYTTVYYNQVYAHYFAHTNYHLDAFRYPLMPTSVRSVFTAGFSHNIRMVIPYNRYQLE